MDKKKYVYVASEIPDECVFHAQVAILAEFTWHLIGPAPYRAHGVTQYIPMPDVKCPIVDVRTMKLDTGNDDRMWQVMNACVDKTSGVFNLSGLLTGLEALGATITPAHLTPDPLRKSVV